MVKRFSKGKTGSFQEEQQPTESDENARISHEDESFDRGKKSAKHDESYSKYAPETRSTRKRRMQFEEGGMFDENSGTQESTITTRRQARLHESLDGDISEESSQMLKIRKSNRLKNNQMIEEQQQQQSTSQENSTQEEPSPNKLFKTEEVQNMFFRSRRKRNRNPIYDIDMDLFPHEVDPHDHQASSDSSYEATKRKHGNRRRKPQGTKRKSKRIRAVNHRYFPQEIFKSPEENNKMHRTRHNQNSPNEEEDGMERLQMRISANGVGRPKKRRAAIYGDDPSGMLHQEQEQKFEEGSDQMIMDQSVTFESIGGLSSHIAALKEIVIFPLLYPEVFAKFNAPPPRGVIFHGPPGTGKTLVARAIANEIGKVQGVKYSFFMRKGADVFSMWNGESERALRDLFDEAYKRRPSVIFFDEIDGLAPVRSSRQEQIHCSVVSTLLALMDGLDDRGQVIVIGATNRIDAIDPALRRPGRFDREFLFQLPNRQSRLEILKIHTSKWDPIPTEETLSRIAEKTTGFCGADLKALCTESTIIALRKSFPEIYSSKERMPIDMDAIQIREIHFDLALQKITPASQRETASCVNPLDDYLQPLLGDSLEAAKEKLRLIFPSCMQEQNQNGVALPMETDNQAVDILNFATIRENPSIPLPTRKLDPHRGLRNICKTRIYKPRMVVLGEGAKHMASALLHYMEHIPVHTVDLPSLHSTKGASSMEDSLCTLFREAKRSVPCVIHLDMVDEWLGFLTESAQTTLRCLLSSIDPRLPLLVLASGLSMGEAEEWLLSPEVSQILHLPIPTQSQRRDFFQPLIFQEALRPPHKPLKNSTKEDAIKKIQDEENDLSELQGHLRAILIDLSSDSGFEEFFNPVTLDEAPDYDQIIEHPMSLSVIKSKMAEYQCLGDFLKDIDLIRDNALTFNQVTHPRGEIIRRKAHALRDKAYWLASNMVDENLDARCNKIKNAREKRKNQEPQFESAQKLELTASAPEAIASSKSCQTLLNQTHSGDFRTALEETSGSPLNESDSGGSSPLHLPMHQDHEMITTVDPHRAIALLEKIAVETDAWNLESLIKLYVELDACIDSFTEEWDRTELLGILENAFKNF